MPAVGAPGDWAEASSANALHDAQRWARCSNRRRVFVRPGETHAQ